MNPCISDVGSSVHRSSFSVHLPGLAAQVVCYRGLKEQEFTEATERALGARFMPGVGSVSVYSVFFVFNNLAMHPLFTHASGMTHEVIGATIEVHKEKRTKVDE